MFDRIRRYIVQAPGEDRFAEVPAVSLGQAALTLASRKKKEGAYAVLSPYTLREHQVRCFFHEGFWKAEFVDK